MRKRKFCVRKTIYWNIVFAKKWIIIRFSICLDYHQINVFVEHVPPANNVHGYVLVKVTAHNKMMTNERRSETIINTQSAAQVVAFSCLNVVTE